MIRTYVVQNIYQRMPYSLVIMSNVLTGVYLNIPSKNPSFLIFENEYILSTPFLATQIHCIIINTKRYVA